MFEKTILINDEPQLNNLFGSLDCNIRKIEQQFHVAVSVRDNAIKLRSESGDALSKAAEAITLLMEKGEAVSTDEQQVNYIIASADDGSLEDYSELSGGAVCVSSKGALIKPKTFGQKKYLDRIENHAITIAVGPAGTGKTYLAVAEAVKAYREKQISRIILTRPAVEAGERLGFLPGDLQNKVDPYLRPLNDALFDILGPETYSKLSERGEIEIAPLAYMRGRTLDNSFIILDEAQNTTKEQMKMFLTRMGFGSKIVITGDITQTDLPVGQVSGLKDAVNVLKEISDIAIIYLSAKDIVRHPLVQKIVTAYEHAEHTRPAVRPNQPEYHADRKERV